MHREGYTLEDVQLMVAAAGLASGNQLLSALEQEVLLSWVAVVFLSLQEAGVPRDLQVGAPRILRFRRTTKILAKSMVKYQKVSLCLCTLHLLT